MERICPIGKKAKTPIVEMVEPSGIEPESQDDKPRPRYQPYGPTDTTEIDGISEGTRSG